MYSYDHNTYLVGYLLPYNEKGILNKSYNKILFKPENITLSSSLSTTISIITMLLILFIYMPGQWFNIVNILTLILFKA